MFPFVFWFLFGLWRFGEGVEVFRADADGVFLDEIGEDATEFSFAVGWDIQFFGSLGL